MPISHSKNPKKIILFVLFLVWLAVILYSNFKGIIYNCFHATDFSIYQQAIYEIADGAGLNPYLTIRNIKIFNDHFDPVLLFAVPFVWLTNYSPLSLILFEFLWFFAIFIFIYKKIEEREKLLPLLIIPLFTKGFLSGLEFPIHPSTWAMFPSILLGWFIIKENKKGIILTSLTLLFFKESFAFGVIGLSFYYFLTKEWKTGITLFGIAVLNIIFVFKLRPLLMGEVYSYSGWVLRDLPFGIFTKLDYKAFFKVFYPFFIPIFLIFKSLFKNRKWVTPELAILFYTAPLFMILVLTNKIHFQYGAQIVGPLLALIFFSAQRRYWVENKKTFIFTVLLFIASGIGSHTKVFKNVFVSKNKQCIQSPAKISSTKEVKNIVLKTKGNILSTGGVAPNLLEPGMKLHQAGMYSKFQDNFSLLVLEKPGTGNHYPYSKEIIQKTIETCSLDDIIFNDEWFLVIQNPGVSCLEPLKTHWLVGS